MSAVSVMCVCVCMCLFQIGEGALLQDIYAVVLHTEPTTKCRPLQGLVMMNSGRSVKTKTPTNNLWKRVQSAAAWLPSNISIKEFKAVSSNVFLFTDIKLPHLSKEGPEPSIVVIPVEPLEPVPITLLLRSGCHSLFRPVRIHHGCFVCYKCHLFYFCPSATFTGSDGRTYTCNLDPICLEFHDLWLPLTLVHPLCDADKIKLTFDLWQKFTNQTKGR